MVQALKFRSRFISRVRGVVQLASVLVVCRSCKMMSKCVCIEMWISEFYFKTHQHANRKAFFEVFPVVSRLGRHNYNYNCVYVFQSSYNYHRRENTETIEG